MNALTNEMHLHDEDLHFPLQPPHLPGLSFLQQLLFSAFFSILQHELLVVLPPQAKAALGIAKNAIRKMYM
jgi:hypothetical protein